MGEEIQQKHGRVGKLAAPIPGFVAAAAQSMMLHPVSMAVDVVLVMILHLMPMGAAGGRWAAFVGA